MKVFDLKKFVNSKRIVRSYIQHLQAPAFQVFLLLCPTKEYEWIESWKCDLIYSESGFAEDNCIFKTNYPIEGSEEVWVVTRYEKNKEIQFVRVNDSRVIRYTITLTDNKDGTTTANWEQIITSLNKKGDKYIQYLTKEKYNSEMSMCEKMLNHFLTTHTMMKLN